MDVASARLMRDCVDLGRWRRVFLAVFGYQLVNLALHVGEEDGLDLPQGIVGHLATVHQGSIQRLLLVAGMIEVRVLSLALGDPQLKVAQLRSLALENNIARDARFRCVRILDLQAAKTLERVVPDDGRGQVGRRILTRRALDSGAPAAAVLAARELYELGGDVDAVCRVVDRLAAAVADIIFVPAVAVELVLLTRVSEGCIESAAA